MKDFIKDVSMRLIIEGGPRVSDGDAACPAQSGQQIKQTCKRWLKILDIYTMGGPQELYCVLCCLNQTSVISEDVTEICPQYQGEIVNSNV